MVSILDKVIRRVPNFPKEGVLFYDVTGILVNPQAFGFCIDEMCGLYAGEKIDAVAAIESRGFIFAAPFAARMGIPLVLVRKKGKLPGEKLSEKYALEYGEAEVEIQKSDVKRGQRVLLLDDLIATGGTLAAARSLVERAGGEVAGCFGIIGLPFLKYAEALAPLEVKTLINFEGE